MLRGTLPRVVVACGSLLVAGALLGAGCGGTVVFDAPDPKACGEGHGCPMAGCACGDGSVILDTTCELGECLPIEQVCNERCEAFEGAVSAFGTPDDIVPIPNCDTFCSRVVVNGCELGCDTLFSECVAPSSCDQAAATFWRCVTEEAVMSCVDNAVRIERCDASALGLCQVDQAGE